VFERPPRGTEDRLLHCCHRLTGRFQLFYPRKDFNASIFFAIRGTAKEEDDPHGTVLPSDMAALSYAEGAIAQLQKEDGYGNPGMTMIVQNDTHQRVWSIPFRPAGA
jgi:hypothetical protein